MAMSLQAQAASETIVLGMGCFWGAEKRMGAIPGVLDVEAGYAGGDAPVVGYEDVLALERQRQAGRSTQRNHAEVVKVSFDPARVGLETILIHFWENHDPTQGERQGNDIGSNYRSAIYYTSEEQKALALQTRDIYQKALSAKGFGPITTEIAPLRHYNRAEDGHQDYLVKNPRGYCGLGGTGVPYPRQAGEARPEGTPAPWDGKALHFERQLIVFESPGCPFCARLHEDVLDRWQAATPMVTTLSPQPPEGWILAEALHASPTVVLFEKGREVARLTGYEGDPQRFWAWLGRKILTPEQQLIALGQGTEPPFSGPYLDEKRRGTFVDPITGAPLFRAQAKFDSGSGWPSFYEPIEGAVTLHEDTSHGMRRIEVRSASSGIHLGHVFDDGPAPTGQRYCINGQVLRFVPEQE